MITLGWQPKTVSWRGQRPAKPRTLPSEASWRRGSGEAASGVRCVPVIVIYFICKWEHSKSFCSTNERSSDRDHTSQLMRREVKQDKGLRERERSLSIYFNIRVFNLKFVYKTERCINQPLLTLDWKGNFLENNSSIWWRGERWDGPGNC